VPSVKKRSVEHQTENRKLDLWALYRQMLRSRLFEERVKDLWEEGKISGEMHMGLGEEAVAAGVVAHLRDGDAMALDHRGTSALVIRGVDLRSLLREFMGCSDGLCRGLGGHMHLFSPEFLSASSGIVGASVPMGAGFALASQHLRREKIAVAFFGEGAMNQGMILESLNLAVVWKLPLLFVCKDNQLAITTHSPSVTSGDLLERVKGFGMPAIDVDGVDVEAVWQAGKGAIQRARKGEGPTFLLAHCVHFEGHFLGDPFLRVGRYPLKRIKEISGPLIRSAIAKKGESAGKRLQNLCKVSSLTGKAVRDQKSKRFDPVYRLRQKLKKDKSRLNKTHREVRQEIDRAVELSLSDQDE
jgi:pyruvate dehydrogenase E1 component alpha subunit